ncbi:hypothetical protein WMY93_025457 [Mugilogobius chulae]|uniref:CCN family member 1 n=1 Tax=Mugilogobius chulae TaxID=88201 RepID=A0AAW0NCG3_9GOBI
MLSVAVFLLGSLNLVLSSSCPAVCECPVEMPKCAPGVSVVLDGCGCCKVCARQLNEDCSLTEPCDHTKGLECNFGASFALATTRGICRAKSEGRPCEYNSKIYQNGESFQPNCKHQCTCIDGAVGCVPLCPQELSLPNLGCANPRLVKVPGQCCEEWVCDDTKEIDILEKIFGKDFLNEEMEKDLTNRNELITIVKGGLKSLPAYRQQPECSKSCGTGISSRVTNNNSECKLVKETRICEVRPCTQSPYSSLKKGKKCSRTKKSSQPMLHPHDTRTIRVKFRCEDGETFNKNIMMIESCKCTYNCPHANEASYPFYRLSNDIHKFRD